MPRDLTKDEQECLCEMRTICRVWLECPAPRRPSADALGKWITEIAEKLSCSMEDCP